jgi:hypothetical protein
LAVAKPRSIEANNAVVTSEAIYQSAENEILNHGAIPMEEDYARRGGIAAFDVMKAHSFALDKDTDWRVSMLRYDLKYDVAEDQKDNYCQNDHQDDFGGRHPINL